jgi:transcriptional regulator with XRE-family HTH domain
MIVPRPSPIYTPCRADATGRASVAQTVSRAVIRLRVGMKLTQGGLASLSGVSRSTVNAIESGQKENLHVTTLVALAYALAIRPDGLLGYAPHPRLCPAAALFLGQRPASV